VKPILDVALKFLKNEEISEIVVKIMVHITDVVKRNENARPAFEQFWDNPGTVQVLIASMRCRYNNKLENYTCH
jgi:hypothetical protein